MYDREKNYNGKLYFCCGVIKTKILYNTKPAYSSCQFNISMDNVIQRKQSQTTLHDFLLINEFQLSIETVAIMIQRHKYNKYDVQKNTYFLENMISLNFIFSLLE